MRAPVVPPQASPKAPSSLPCVAGAQLVHGDCLTWLQAQPDQCVHAVVTDPPYGLREYSHKEQRKLRGGRGGVWRIPPTLDGRTRMPLPRFTTLTPADLQAMRAFFTRWAEQVARVLVPGGHLMVASNPLVSHHVYLPIMAAGLEKRGEIVRLVQTLRGGDRPKNAHLEFPQVSVMPRAAWEPWGLFRKPCAGKVSDCLRAWQTGGLLRPSPERPFSDVIACAPTQARERRIAAHPSLKPQAFMRQLVRAALPMGQGVILDPFMGGGATVAAALACGYACIGVEQDDHYFDMACQAIPRLRDLKLKAKKRKNGTG